MKLNLRKMVLASLFASLMAVCAWISIPISPVAVTLQTFGVLMALGTLGGKWGTVSVWIYLALGILGVPVFAGFRGGPGALLDPSGGFLWGFVLGGLAYRMAERLGKLPGMIVCQLVCYGCGCLWFSRWAVCSMCTAVLTCVVPYLIPDGLKLWLALTLSRRIAGQLK